MIYKKPNTLNPIVVDMAIYVNVMVFICLGLVSLPVFAKKQTQPAKPLHTEVAKDVPDIILVKVKKQALTQLNTNSDRAQTGVKSVDDKIKSKSKSIKNEKLFKKSKNSDNNSELSRWTKVKITNPGNPATDASGNTYYPDVDAMIDDLKNDPNVEAVEKDKSVPPALLPNDTYYSTYDNLLSGLSDMWGLKNMKAEQAWDITTGSSSVIAAVLDTGVDYNHEDLAANIWQNSHEIANNGVDDDGNGYIDDTRGWDFIQGNNDPADKLDYSYSGHGSHVAGSIAAVGNNGIGIAGMSWNSKIMPIRVCGPGNCTQSAIISGLQYATDNGAKVVNMSLGAANTYYKPTADAIKYAHDHDVTVVTAAGNDSQDSIINMHYPSSDPNSIAIGAIDETLGKASFSNYGAKVDVFAPGKHILSVKAQGAYLSGYTCNPIFATKYCGLLGTSMATPQVTGIVALMLSANPNLKNEQIRQILRYSAVSMGPIDTYGYGIVKADKSVQSSISPNVLVPYMSNSIYNSSTSKILPITGSVLGPNIASYKLEIGNGHYPSSWTKLTEGTTNIAPDSTIYNFNTYTIANGSYTLRLTATNVSGDSYFFAIHNVNISNITDTTPPSTPTNITSTPTMTSLALRWTNSTDNVGILKYIVKRNGTVVGMPTDANFTDTGLQPGAAYTYTIQANDLAGNLSNEASANFFTLPDSAPPSQVTNFIATNITRHGLSLNWDNSTDNVGVAGYKIYRNGTLVQNLNNTSWGDSNLTSNTSYTYTIEAYDSMGNTSTQTTIVVQTLADNIPPTVSFNLPFDGSTQYRQTRVNLNANDDDAILKVELFINGQIAKTFTSAPYDDTINLIAYANGSVSIVAVATDVSGNSAQASRSIYVSNPKRGDLNNDNKIDIYDISLLLVEWNKTNIAVDLNGDNIINIYDLSILLSQYGK